jgi:hypothetical protein
LWIKLRKKCAFDLLTDPWKGDKIRLASDSGATSNGVEIGGLVFEN